MPATIIFHSATIRRHTVGTESDEVHCTLLADVEILVPGSAAPELYRNQSLYVFQPPGTNFQNQPLRVRPSGPFARVRPDALRRAVEAYYRNFVFQVDLTAPHGAITLEDHTPRCTPRGYRVPLEGELNAAQSGANLLTTIPVRETMSKCVRSIGGEVLDEILRTPKFKNADYFFRQESVIAELKSLETDFCADPVFLKRIDALWLDWADRGLVSGPIPESVVVSPDILPKECVREVTVLIRKKLQDSFLKTANTQIRKTAEHLGITDYRGLLIIAADGNYSLPPYFVVQAVCEACRSVKPDGRSVYSGINSVLYISANRPAFVPWSHEDRGVFICQGIDNRPDVGEGLITRLMEAWVGESSRLLGGEGSLKKVDPGGDPNDIHYR